jgi:voltage-gated potassium channel
MSRAAIASYQRPHWGLRLALDERAARVERLWRLPVGVALVATIPAFYAGLLGAVPPLVAALVYVIAAVVTAAALGHTALRCAGPRTHLAGNPVDHLLIIGLLLAAVLPASDVSGGALTLRFVVALLTLVRLVWALQLLLARGSITYLMTIALGVLLLCGAGFWWLEPRTPTFADGLWLAFTTAATVGYGDVVPSTPASKIFAVFVVLLGFGVLTLATAAIATMWIGTEERRIEREILHDLRQQLGVVHADLKALRAELRSRHALHEGGAAGPAAGPPAGSSKAPGGAPASAADPRRSGRPPSRSSGR